MQRRVDCNQLLKWGRLYGFEYKRGIVTEAKGSPEYVILEDGTHTHLKRAGMKRTGKKLTQIPTNGKEPNSLMINSTSHKCNAVRRKRV